jgi:hypothetical protein
MILVNLSCWSLREAGALSCACDYLLIFSAPSAKSLRPLRSAAEIWALQDATAIQGDKPCN